MTGFNSKQAMAADKLQEPVSEALKRLAEKLRRAGASIPAPQVTGTIEGSVVSGLCVALAIVEGEIEALAQPAQEPYDQTALELCNVCGWKTLIPDDGCLNCERKAQPAQEALYGMNQDDWKDVVAAITKVRDGRGIYLGCRPADVFKDWFLALGTAKVKEKNND